MKRDSFKEFWGFTWKVMVTHTLTYCIFGLIMSKVLDYGSLFQQDIIRDFMRPIDSPYIFAGPLMQPLRGLLFAIGLWPLRDFILEKKHGWLILWNIILMFGILSTPAASPGSVEGIIYTKLPLWFHFYGIPEILPQTLVFSFVLVLWDKSQYRITAGSQAREKSPFLLDVIKAVMTGCFAWVGYAVGGLLSVALASSTFNIEIDMEVATSLRTQMLFVVAFVVNVIAVFFIARKWSKGKFSIWQIFVIFWAIDTVVPLLYQLVFTAPSPLHMALLLGFFPAVIITVCIRLNYRKAVL